MTRRLLPYGERAVLVELDDLDEVVRLQHALDEDPLPGVVEVVPAARTVAIVVDPRRLGVERAGRWALACPAPPIETEDADEAVIEVDYGGPDLAGVAELLRCSEREVVAWHTGAQWRVAFTGFAPGFGYLVCRPPHPPIPRLEVPRSNVPAGSVGLAGEFSGVYPRRGPGGWRLIGETEAVLWDAEADHPVLLSPGRRVRFTEAT